MHVTFVTQMPRWKPPKNSLLFQVSSCEALHPVQCIMLFFMVRNKKMIKKFRHLHADKNYRVQQNHSFQVFHNATIITLRLPSNARKILRCAWTCPDVSCILSLQLTTSFCYHLIKFLWLLLFFLCHNFEHKNNPGHLQAPITAIVCA